MAATLRALATLVPVLGPEVHLFLLHLLFHHLLLHHIHLLFIHHPQVVIGANRTKVFSDGSPSKGRLGGGGEVASMGLPSSSSLGLLPHAPPPPPALFTPREEQEEQEEEAGWHDNWGTEEQEEEEEEESTRPEVLATEQEQSLFAAQSSKLTSNVEMMIKNVEDLDIMKLDVKVPKTKTHKVEDVDFFADMKPEIPKAASALEQFEEKLKSGSNTQIHSMQVLAL